MSKPTQDYLDGYLRGISQGQLQLVDKLIEIAQRTPDDDYKIKSQLVSWLENVREVVRTNQE